MRPARIARRAALALLLAGCGAGDAEGPSRAADQRWPGGALYHREVPASEDGPALHVTLVRLDPRSYEPVLLTAARDGGGLAHSLERWADRHDLAAVVNASMYLPNLRSTGLMVDGDHVNNPAVNARFGGYLFFNPREEGRPAVVLTGADCAGESLDSLRVQYRTVVQNYRLLDCEGEPVPWEDRKLYSSAAIGVDREGWLVFVHSGAPARASDLARWLARPEWGLLGAVFVEGGADAALLVETPRGRLLEVGGYEGTYRPADRSRPVPNVIGVRRRTAPE